MFPFTTLPTIGLVVTTFKSRIKIMNEIHDVTYNLRDKQALPVR